MPEAKRYRVSLTQSVDVTANDPVSACRIAREAFSNGQNSENGVKLHPEENPRLEGVWGNTASRIRDESIFAEKI